MKIIMSFDEGVGILKFNLIETVLYICLKIKTYNTEPKPLTKTLADIIASHDSEGKKK